MQAPRDPILTANEFNLLAGARRAGESSLQFSLDLGLSVATVSIGPMNWGAAGNRYPYPERYKDRTIYYWDDDRFAAVSRYASSLIKLVPTEWGAPTFEIDGIKMLPTSIMSPYEDAQRKVALIQPRGKVVLDTCGGLGYFADWCIRGGATQVRSYEKNPDVIWLRSLNPWSPRLAAELLLVQGDISVAVKSLPDQSVDAVLHDPPRFGIAGELYSLDFYLQLARVLKPKGRMFHYTGSPNRLAGGRDVPGEVIKRLKRALFRTEKSGDGVIAIRL